MLAAGGAARPVATSASSPRPNSGDLSARASDRSCVGETSASSSATMSCTSGASTGRTFRAARRAGAGAQGPLAWWPGGRALRPSPAPLWAACRWRSGGHQAAACAHSRMRWVSSASWRGSVGCRARPAGRGPPPSPASSRIGDGGQAQQLALVFRFGGVVAKTCGLLLRLAWPMTALTAAITPCALRRVWSQLKGRHPARRAQRPARR